MIRKIGVLDVFLAVLALLAFVPVRQAAAQNNTIGGAIIGGGIGAIVGGAATGKAGGAVAGGCPRVCWHCLGHVRLLLPERCHCRPRPQPRGGHKGAGGGREA